jgi:hypothetical protein
MKTSWTRSLKPTRSWVCLFSGPSCQGSFVILLTLQSIHRNHFLDSHSAFSAPSDVAIGDVHQVEMETYQPEITAEGSTFTFCSANFVWVGLIAYSENAVVLGIHGQDASLEEILANFARDSAGGGEMPSLVTLFPPSLTSRPGVTHGISADYGDEIFSPYSDDEEEGEESEEELSSEE